MTTKSADRTQKTIGLTVLLTGSSYGLYRFWKNKEKATRLKECPICLEMLLPEFVTFSCQHSFHKKCINVWQNIKKTCPVCRSHINQTVL